MDAALRIGAGVKSSALWVGRALILPNDVPRSPVRQRWQRHVCATDRVDDGASTAEAEERGWTVQARAHRPVEVRVLGEPSVLLDGTVVPVGSAQQRAVLVALALAGGSPVSGERLAQTLWSEDRPDSARVTVRSLVYRLRRTLSEAGVPDGTIVGTAIGWALGLDADEIDVVRFEPMCAQGNAALARADHESAAEVLGHALACWTGPAFGDVATYAALAGKAQRLEQARATAVEDLAEVELALGRTATAANRLEELLETEPLRERAWALLMLAHYRLGRQAHALDAHRRAREALDAVGLEPGPKLRNLEVDILRHNPNLLL